MRSVNLARLKNQLSKYVTFARAGEEVIIRHRKIPVAKLVPFTVDDASPEELHLVAEGKMRLAEVELDVERLFKIATFRVQGNAVTKALLDDRDEK